MVKYVLRPITFPNGMINLGFIKRVIQKVVGVPQAFSEQWRGLGMLAPVDLGTQGPLAAHHTSWSFPNICDLLQVS